MLDDVELCARYSPVPPCTVLEQIAAETVPCVCSNTLTVRVATHRPFSNLLSFHIFVPVVMGVPSLLHRRMSHPWLCRVTHAGPTLTCTASPHHQRPTFVMSLRRFRHQRWWFRPIVPVSTVRTCRAFKNMTKFDRI